MFHQLVCNYQDNKHFIFKKCPDNAKSQINLNNKTNKNIKLTNYQIVIKNKNFTYLSIFYRINFKIKKFIITNFFSIKFFQKLPVLPIPPRFFKPNLSTSFNTTNVFFTKIPCTNRSPFLIAIF